MSDIRTTLSSSTVTLPLNSDPKFGSVYGEETPLLPVCIMTSRGGVVPAHAGLTVPGSIFVELEWEDLDRTGPINWIRLARDSLTLHLYPSHEYGLVLEGIELSDPPRADHPLHGELRRLLGDEVTDLITAVLQTPLVEGNECHAIDRRRLLEQCQEAWQAFDQANRDGVLADHPVPAAEKAARRKALLDGHGEFVELMGRND